MGKIEVEFLSPDEYPLWDRFVDRSPQGAVFCYSWWLQTVTDDDFAILVAKEEKILAAGFILPFWYGGRVDEPYLTRSLGVLYPDLSRLSRIKQANRKRKYLNALLDRVPLERVAQFCTHRTFSDWTPFRWKGFKQTTRYTYTLNFRKHSLNGIYENIHKDHKSTFRKAYRNRIEVELSDDIEMLHRLNCLTFERQSLSFPYSIDSLKKLDLALKSKNKRAMFKAIDHRQRVHAMFYVAFHRRCAFALLSASDPDLRRLGGHTLIVWNAIRYFYGKTELFDFCGSDLIRIEQHIARFGGKQERYFHIYNENLCRSSGNAAYHFKKLLHHAKEIAKIASNKSARDYLTFSSKTMRGAISKISRDR